MEWFHLIVGTLHQYHLRKGKRERERRGLMNEDEIAQMFLDECLYNAGLKEESPFEEEPNEQE